MQIVIQGLVHRPQDRVAFADMDDAAGLGAVRDTAARGVDNRFSPHLIIG